MELHEPLENAREKEIRLLDEAEGALRSCLGRARKWGMSAAMTALSVGITKVRDRREAIER